MDKQESKQVPKKILEVPIVTPSPIQKTEAVTGVPPPTPPIDRSITADAFLNGFSTLIGALIGAMAAYYLQRRIQRSLEEKQAVKAGNRLMFSLLQQINTILLIQKDFVQPNIDDPARFLSIPALPPFDIEKGLLNPSDIDFLLENAKSSAILFDLNIAQQSYVEALTQWNLRSQIHFEKVQPALANAGIPEGEFITSRALLRETIGPLTFGSLENLTNNGIEGLQRAFIKLMTVKTKAQPYFKKQFPQSSFFDFDIPETFGLRTQDLIEDPPPPH